MNLNVSFLLTFSLVRLKLRHLRGHENHFVRLHR